MYPAFNISAICWEVSKVFGAISMMQSSNKVISTLSFDQIQLIKSNIQYETPISSPIKKGQTYGKLIITIGGKPDIEVDLVAQENVGNINPILKVFSALKYLLFGTSLDE